MNKIERILTHLLRANDERDGEDKVDQVNEDFASRDSKLYYEDKNDS